MARPCAERSAIDGPDNRLGAFAYRVVAFAARCAGCAGAVPSPHDLPYTGLDVRTGADRYVLCPGEE